MTHPPPYRKRLQCPQCAASLVRIRRRVEDRRDAADPMARRFRCRANRCEWQGLLSRSGTDADPLRGRDESVPPAPTGRPHKRSWLAGLSGFLGAAAVAGAAVVIGVSPTDAADQWPTTANGEAIALGESYDGEPVSPHPLLQRVAFEAPGAAPAAPAEADSALTLHQRCTWGQPGRNPYKGSVEQALIAAKLPPDVIARVAAKVKARDISDRLTISNSGIRTQHDRRRFDPHSVTMTYGRTLCLQTRVHFKSGHQERADLYEVADAAGKRHSVMVPDVCGNVSVLSAGGVEDPVKRRAALLQAKASSAAEHAEVGPHLRTGLRTAELSASSASQSVPEPATWLGVSVGLLGAWISRRRRR